MDTYRSLLHGNKDLATKRLARGPEFFIGMAKERKKVVKSLKHSTGSGLNLSSPRRLNVNSPKNLNNERK